MDNKKTSIEKSFMVLESLTVEPFEFSASELADINGINRTTMHRILKMLLAGDYIIKSKHNRKYRLGPKLYSMGSIYLNNFNFENNVSEIVNEIAEITQESVGLAIRENDKVVSLYEVENKQPMKMNYRPGIFYPMNRGAYGKILMAYHDQDKVSAMLDEQHFDKILENTITDKEEILKEYAKIRELGYATSVDETYKYGIGIGIPLKSHNGEIETAIGVSFFMCENYEKKIMDILEVLLSYKEQLEKYLK